MIEGIFEIILMATILTACISLIRLFSIANRMEEIAGELRAIRELMQKK